MFEIILYHKQNFHPVIAIQGTNQEALIKQAASYENHFAFQPRPI